MKTAVLCSIFAILQIVMQAQDLTFDPSLTLWYTQPASEWEEALPVGNGRLGAMVFGAYGEERIQINEDTHWSGGPYSTTVEGGLSFRTQLRGVRNMSHSNYATDYFRMDGVGDEGLVVKNSSLFHIKSMINF